MLGAQGAAAVRGTDAMQHTGTAMGGGHARSGGRRPGDTPLKTRIRPHRIWIRLAWALGLPAALAVALLLTRLTAVEVASLAPVSDFGGRDNVLAGALFAQGALLAAALAHRRAPRRRRRQLVAIALGLLAIASLLFGARGVIFMLLFELAVVVSFPPHERR